MTIGILGGIMGPIVLDAAETAVAYDFEYPCETIASISIKPAPDASAMADPDIPAKIMLSTILTCANPPGKWPTIVEANLKIRLVTPVEFMIWAAKMKRGRQAIKNYQVP